VWNIGQDGNIVIWSGPFRKRQKRLSLCWIGSVMRSRSECVAKHRAGDFLCIS